MGALIESSGPLPFPGPGARRPVRVFLTGGTQLVNETVCSALHARPEVKLLGMDPDPQEAIPRIRNQRVEVVLVESTQDETAALATTRLLRDTLPEIEILPLGLRAEDEVVSFAEAGASGYVLAEASLPELVTTIRAVHQKLTPCSPRIAASVFSRISELARRRSPRRPDPEVRLTPRETEVLGLIAAGMRNKEIAQELSITISTVKNHVHKILDKLHADRRRGAVSAACERGLLPDPLPTRGGRRRRPGRLGQSSRPVRRSRRPEARKY